MEKLSVSTVAVLLSKFLLSFEIMESIVPDTEKQGISFNSDGILDQLLLSRELYWYIQFTHKIM